MTTLGEFSDTYEPPKKLNIADLDEVSIDLDLHSTTGIAIKKDKSGKEYEEEYQYHYLQIGNSQYRVPDSVIEEIKKIRKLRPDIKKIKVQRFGSGMGTRYEVTPI